MTKSQELYARAEELMRQANEIRQQEIAAIITDLKQQIKTYKLSAVDLGLAVPERKRQGNKPGQVFRSPNGELWSGKGRQPQWLKDAINTGATKEQFRV